MDLMEDESDVETDEAEEAPLTDELLFVFFHLMHHG
jgi:hypothetical protein